MSVENPTDISQEEKTTSSLSEQFKARRKDSLEKQDKKTRNDLREIFKRYQSGPERVSAIRNILESFSNILSEEQKEYLFNSLDELSNISDEDEFVEKTLPIAKVYLGIRADKLDQFEILDRKRMYDEHPTFLELNQLFAYELVDDEIRLHVPNNEATSIKDKLRLIDDGLYRLAEIVRDNPNIKRVTGRSWIIGANPRLLERLGFEVKELETNPQGIKVGTGIISREKLLELYSK